MERTAAVSRREWNVETRVEARDEAEAALIIDLEKSARSRKDNTVDTVFSVKELF